MKVINTDRNPLHQNKHAAKKFQPLKTIEPSILLLYQNQNLSNDRDSPQRSV